MSRATLRTLAIPLCVLFCGAVSNSIFAQQPALGQPVPPVSQQPPSPESETRVGMWRGRPITYQVINGRNNYQGDIILENVQPMPNASSGGGFKSNSVALSSTTYLWPKVNGVAQIPYVIDSESQNVSNINSAISIYNATFAGVIQLVPHGSQANYTDINLSGSPTGVCEANEGDAGIGEQMVTGASNCTVATILHEFGHVTGLWHEQSRSDAANYVTFNYSNVIKGSISYFLPSPGNDQQNLTYYDYASVMEYPAFAFSRNGGPPLESMPAGMPLSNSVGYSAGDVEGAERLYGSAPTEVTVASNPIGLQLLVDGATITTPMTFSWALNSTHTLSVATGAQTLSGDIANSNPPVATTFYYTYGRWNDGGSQTHTITVTPGNGDVTFPATAPQVATYSANFVQLVPYTSAVYPNSPVPGSISVSPTPQSYTGASGVFFIARQLATLTATPNSGYNFYEFNNANFWLPGGLGANPKTFYVPDTGLAVATTAEFTTSPVYSVDVSPDTFSSNLGVDVDAGFWYTPKNFALPYDSSWTANSTHTLEFPTPQQPFSSNTEFVFSSWNVGGTANSPDSVKVPTTSTSYIATITPEFIPGTNFNYPPCGGNATITPASTNNGFYPSGTQLTYTEMPDTGWTFAGWTYDLTGTSNSAELAPTDESLVFANFNTTNVPLTLTSMNPSTSPSGGPAFTMTLTGTGFTSGSQVGINFPNTFLTPTFVSSTELQMTVPASAIASPTNLQVFVENFPSGWNGCAVFAYQPFFVSQGAPSGTTSVTVTPTTETFPSTVVDTTSTGSAITVKNTGSAATKIAIAASANFGQSNTCPAAPATLAAGATCAITPTFTPTATGTLTGNITVTDNASNSPQVVTFTGTGAAMSNSATPFLTGTPSASTRDNYSGFVGMKFTVGANNLTVTQLGRWVVQGNSQTHTVEIVNASNGTVVSGGSVTVSTAGATSGKYAYAALASPITLQADTAYYIVSQETSGGDYWYNYGAVTASSAGTVNDSAYSANGTSSYVLSEAGSYCYGPVNFLYATGTPPSVSITSPSNAATISGTTTLSATATAASGLSVASVQFQLNGSNLGPALTSAPYNYSFNTTTMPDGKYTLTAIATDSAGDAATSAPIQITIDNNSATPFLTGTPSASTRDNFSGFVGMKFTVGANNLTVTQLGRWVVQGNSQTHTVEIVNASNGTVVSGGSVTVSTAGATSGQYAYAALASPITLQANTAYYIVSQETSGGDYWYNYGAVTANSAGTVNGSAYSANGTSSYVLSEAGSYCYGPVNFLFDTT